LLTHRLVGVCAEAAAALDRERWLAPRPLLVIPNGTPLHKFAAIEPRPQNGEFVFGTVARLSAEKDQHTLLRAFALVLRGGRRARLRLLGNGPERSSLERLAEQLGISRQTVFEGESLHVPEFLAGLDTFLLSSRSEALPLSLLEAMAAALPVVATAVGGIPETVQAASCGWLCRPGDPEALAQAMLAAIDCPDRLSLGARGRRHALRLHSVERMASGYEALFENLLANSEQAAGHAEVAALGS
jgi:glycosyltransferase involved in cell wall biosynthesis